MKSRLPDLPIVLYSEEMFVDAHSHWSDLRFSQSLVQVKSCLEALRLKKIIFFLQAGVDPEEWQRQIQLKKQFPNSFGTCFGLHPYFVIEKYKNSQRDECEAALDQLAALLPSAMALGETGLDFRSQWPEGSESLQIEMFENQIELARVFKKPLVLHIVRAHEKALQVLQMWEASQVGGFVHAFNGSYELARSYLNLGFLLSVGGAITYDKNKKLQETIKKIPLDQLLIETDSPDQPPKDWNNLNTSDSLLKVAEKIAEIRGQSTEEILQITTKNFCRLFNLAF